MTNPTYTLNIPQVSVTAPDLKTAMNLFAALTIGVDVTRTEIPSGKSTTLTTSLSINPKDVMSPTEFEYALHKMHFKPCYSMKNQNWNAQVRFTPVKP